MLALSRHGRSCPGCSGPDDPVGAALPGRPPSIGPVALRHRPRGALSGFARESGRRVGGNRIRRIRARGPERRRGQTGHAWAMDAAVAELPESAPRYLMGVGTPEDLIEGVARGIDLFDCVMPTRHGRTGWLFTSFGRVLIKNAQYARDESPVDPACSCPVCRSHSRAYLRHLFLAKEMLGVRLNTLHNLHYFATLMTGLRDAVCQRRLAEFRDQFYAHREACQT